MDRINRNPVKVEIYLPLDDLHFLFDQYLEDRGQRATTRTRAIMYDKVNFFTKFWQEYGPTVEWQLTPKALRVFNDWLDTYISHATNRILAWNTRNDALRRLRQCFSWCCNHGYMGENVRRLLVEFPTPTGARPVKMPPDLDVWRAIWEAITESPMAVRDAAVFATLAGTGARRAEVAALNFEDVQLLDDDSGFLTIRDSKTGKARIAAFDNFTGQEIRSYIRTWHITRGPLFFSASNEPPKSLDPLSINRIVRRAAIAAGVSHKISGTHDIRRAYAASWVRKLRGEGFSQLLARELGHFVSNNMTFYYAQSASSPEDIRKCLMKHRCSLFAQILDTDKKVG